MIVNAGVVVHIVDYSPLRITTALPQLMTLDINTKFEVDKWWLRGTQSGLFTYVADRGRITGYKKGGTGGGYAPIRNIICVYCCRLWLAQLPFVQTLVDTFIRCLKYVVLLHPNLPNTPDIISARYKSVVQGGLLLRRSYIIEVFSTNLL